MMKKNISWSIFQSRIDFILTPGFGVQHNLDLATETMQLGVTVILKKDGRHQEMYAVEDAGYRIGDPEHEDNVAIAGRIGEVYNKIKSDVTDGQASFSKRMANIGPYGKAAETFLETKFNKSWFNRDLDHEVVILDLDNETVIDRDGETISVKFIRPNKDVIIAVEA
jgi:hypothetical protein